MAGKTFYPINAKATGANHMQLQDGGTPPTAATTGTGWGVDNHTPTKYASMSALAERIPGSFVTAPKPDAPPNNTLGDCWRSESPLTGLIVPGTWTFHFPVIAVTAGAGQDGRVRVRVWKGASATGSDAVELTGTTLLGALVTNLTTTTEQDSWCTWTPTADIVMNNDYLFVQVAWEITGQATDLNADVLFRVGYTARIETSFIDDFWFLHPYHYSGSLFVLAPQPVFRAQVDAQTLTDGGVFGTSIKQYIFVKNITLGDASMATIEEGMTITIGATSGGEQLGRARVRGVYNFSGTNVIMVWASPNKKDGEIFLNTDQYVTVWDDYRVWMKPPYAVGGNYTYDGDKGPLEVMYDCKPIANAGPGYAGEVDPVSGLITVSFSGQDSFAADYDAVLGGYSADRCTGGTPTASSSNGANTPDKAFDDSTATYWESVGVSNQSINYEWAAYDKHLRKVSLTASGTTAPKDFLIYAQYMHDGFTTRTVRHVKNQTAWGTNETRSFTFNAPLNAKKVTIYVISNNGGASIRIEEIAVFEEDRTAASPYAWNVKDGTITVGSSTSETITATFPAGFRWVKLTVTDTNGKTGVCRIPVAAVNETDHLPIRNFEVVSQELAVEGQTIEFRVYENIPKETYPDNTLIMYWEREVYRGFAGSLAGPAGREHMKFVGWIDEEPTQIEVEETSLRRYTSLRCIDVGGKLQQLPGFNLMVERVTQTTPTGGLLMDHANIDRFVYLILRWLSTAAEVADFIWSGTSELWQFPIMSAEGGSIYDMADGRCQAAVMRLTCNKHGQLVMRYDPIVLTSADRDYTNCLELLPDDYRSVDYTVHRSSRFHWLWGSALMTSYLGPNEVGGTAAVPIFVVAPGEAPGQGLGLLEQGEQLVQDSANLAQREGHRYNARLNAPHSNFTLVLAHGGDNGIDPAEMKFVQINIPTEIAAQRNLYIYLDSTSFFLPFRVSIEHDHQAQTKTVTIEIEREYSAYVPLAVVYTPP